MSRYLLSIYQPEGQPPPEVLDPIMADLGALTGEMRAAGAWVFSVGLAPAGEATVVRDGAALVTDGPFTEGKEHLGGFTVIEAPDRAAALVWAGRMAGIVTVPVEVRLFG